jgi:heme-degrading monooxygenase HmoA
MASPAALLTELPQTEVEVHHRLWVRRERIAALDALRDQVHVHEVPGLRVWRTLLPTSFTGGEAELPYVIVSVWADQAAFERWRDSQALESHAAVLAEGIADLLVRAPEVTVYRVTCMVVC